MPKDQIFILHGVGMKVHRLGELDLSFLLEGGTDLSMRIKSLEVRIGVRLLDEIVERIEIQSKIKVVDERLLIVADIDESSIQGGKEFLHSSEENIPHREIVTLTGLSVVLDKLMVLHKRELHL